MGLHKLRLAAAVPVTFSSRLFLKPFTNTLTLGLFSRHLQPRNKPLLVRAFSASAAVQDIPATQTSDSSGIPVYPLLPRGIAFECKADSFLFSSSKASVEGSD